MPTGIQSYGSGAGLQPGTVDGTTGLTVNQKRFYESVMIKRLLPYLVYLDEDSEKGTVPENAGGFTANSLRWYVQGAALPLATTALTEGTPPTSNTLDWTEVATQLAQYGGITKHTDILAHAGLSNVLTQIAEALGEQAGRTIHALMLNVILGGTNVLYGGGSATRTAVPASTAGPSGKLVAADLKRAGRDLTNRNVEPFPDGTYHAVISLDQAYDLMDDPVWRSLNGSVYGLGSQMGMKNFEVGQIWNVKVRVTNQHTIITKNTGSPLAPLNSDIQQGVVYGPGAFGFRDFAAWKLPRLSPQTGRGIRLYVVSADVPSRDDPLGQTGVMGWKTAFGGMILDNNRIERIETTATLSPNP